MEAELLRVDVLMEQEKNKEAALILEEIHPRCSKELGEDDTLTLNMERKLAWVYMNLKNYEKTLKVLELNISHFEVVFGT